MTDPLDAKLSICSPLLLDGALATELERRGADLDDPLWSAKLLVEAPHLIREVHYDYLCAGSDIIITSTYQATFEGFRQRGIPDNRAAELMRLSISLANDARQQFAAERSGADQRSPPLIAASIGPYGAYLHDGSEYRGRYGLTIEQLMDFHRPRMATLAECIHAGEADLIACETIPSQIEAVALVRLLEIEFPTLRAWICFSCCDESHICEGDSFAYCVQTIAQSEQICGVGLNCTSPHFVAPLLASVPQNIGKPLIVYPNGGDKWDDVNRCWLDAERGTDFANLVPQWYAGGARIIGGCCRTTPRDIHTIKQTLKNAHSIQSNLPHL